MGTARARAVANENASIDASQSRALAAREAEQSRPRNALEAMAHRLQVSPQGLKDTLLKTVFSGCRNDAEFIALTVVSNEYGLNPLTKEIYAFPAKGGGIVPMVSVDGWIRIMNEHPAFDGIEFDHIVDQKGKIEAIEAVIYRKDRGHPIKVIEYLEECRRGTEPWKQMPNRMLRNRALIQGARIAFGFSGIAAEGDEIEIEAQPMRSLPSNRSLAEELDDEIPTFDGETGEVIEQKRTRRPEPRGMTEVDEETARKLDAGEDETEYESGEAEQPEPAEDDAPAWAQEVADIKAQVAASGTLPALKKADDRFTRNRVALPDEIAEEIDGLIAAKRREISAQGGEG